MVFKIITLIGTRPEIIRLSRFIEQADKYFNQILIHSGQNYSTNLGDIFFDEMKIRKPDHYLDVIGDHLGETMGNIISKSYDIFQKLKPDCLVILGDTNTGLAVISAKRLKIPIFHIESGQRSQNENLPEEINRRIIDHSSDINLCYSENSRRNLIKEGLRIDHIFVIGSPMKEVLDYYYQDILNSKIMDKLKLDKNKFFVLSLHREQHIDEDKIFNQLINSLDQICHKYNLPIIFSTHPRTLKKLEGKNIHLNPLVKVIPALGFFDFCNLEINSLCVLSDSGSEPEIAPILNYPIVSIRDSTERQEAIDKGNIILGNLKSETILDSINIAINTHNKQNKIMPYDYMDDNVSIKIIKIIQSYVPIVNKVIWFKNE